MLKEEENEDVTIEQIINTTNHNHNEQFIFDNNLYQKIIKLKNNTKGKDIYKEKFSLQLSKRIMHFIEYFEGSIDSSEEPTTVTNLQIITKNKIKEILKRVKHFDRIKYLHLGCIQITIKANFRAGLDSPITLIISDNRLITTEQSLMGIIQSNLLYQVINFKLFPNFSISLADKNIDQSLMIFYKLENILMLKGSKPLTFTWRLLGHFSETNNVEIKPIPSDIRLDDLHNQYSEIIYPRQLTNKDIQVPIEWNINLEEIRKNHIIEKPPIRQLQINEGRLSIGYNRPLQRTDSMNITNRKLQIKDLTQDDIDLPSSSTRLRTNNVKLDLSIIQVLVSFNDKTITIKALIDTGASLSHIKSKLIENNISKAEKKRYYTFDKQIHELIYKANIDSLMVIDTHNELHALEFETIYSDERSTFDMLIGQDILQKHYPLQINYETIQLQIKEQIIHINRAKECNLHTINVLTNDETQNNYNKISFNKIEKDAKNSTEVDIGYEFYSFEDIIIQPNTSTKIRTCISAKICTGYYGLIKEKKWLGI
ncbi:hypothetical protein AXF42_Ash013790 [Apostasia shenzhenica]|uniref:Retropepsins domain-containing protein n=1 Tax=Apostasia shenzhenica TaxID=1088818 RepID=A0A2I0A4U9_9ASPA|nr:hypothetical protein AXF42_Ash013790 [Apostasia shenzhenica]